MFRLFLLTTFLGFSLGHQEQYKVTDQVYLDIAVDNEPFGRIVIGLFGETTPLTVKNFLTIVTKGINGKTYAGSRFHRIIKRFMIQGGDIVNNDGTGAVSIYGNYFKDENFKIGHNDRGFVSMANSGPNTNACQFFITTVATPWLNSHHTVFGKVVNGLDIVMKIERLQTDIGDKPVKPVIIKSCGLIPTPTPFFISDDHYNLIEWAYAGAVPLGFSFLILAFFHYVIRKLQKSEDFKLHAQ